MSEIPSFAIKGGPKPQLAEQIFCRAMTAMKNQLKAAEWKFDGDRNCDGFKFFKAHVMDVYYFMLEDIFANLVKLKMVVPCGCGASIKSRNGWTHCGWCHGSGYRNSKEYNDFLADQGI